MDGNAADNSGAAENIVENQDQECEPVKLIPEGFVVDDSLPSIFLEDFEENNEVWLVDVPVAVNPLKLIGQQLDFRQETSFFDEQTNEKCVTLPSDEPCSANCLLSSKIDNSRKEIVSLNPSGKISININYDVPALGAMIPEGTSVPLPVGLKVRHPFLGSVFKSPMETMEGPSEKVDMLLLQNKKKPVANEHMSTDVSPLKKVPRESLNKMAVKNEVISPKKSKKRKRESLDGDGNNVAHEYSGDSPVHLSKKHKKEKAEEGHFHAKTEFLGSAISNEVMELSVEEAISVKKSKKDKKRASAIIESELSAAVFPEEVDVASSPLQMQKKKIKKEKKGHQWSGEGEGVMDVSLVESPKKAKKKKKRESEILSEAGQNGQVPTDIVMIGEVPSRTLGSVKGTRMEFHEGPREFADKSLHEEQIEVLYEEGDHVKKKKKDKKRESNIVSKELDVEVWRGEVDVMPETPEQTPKKKIMEEHKISLKAEGVADISLLETSLPFVVGEETPKKSKKKKKRDSEISDVVGQSGVMSDIELIEGTPDKTLSKEKKIKKEIKREMDRSSMQVSYDEGGNAEERKSKKRRTLDKADVETLYADCPDRGMILGRKGMEEMETINEEVEVLLEAGDHVKKKKKKDKKRESEIVSNELDVEAMAEVVVIPDTPEQTQKKKKKKIKQELDLSMNAEGMADVLMVELSVSSESGSSKKTKKKKKRESECGSGAGLSGLSTDIVKLEEFTAQASGAVGKLKKEKWFIDCEPTNVPNNSFKSPPEVKKMHGEVDLDAQLGGESSGVSYMLNSGSKKGKRRHTMDAGDTAALIADQNRINLPPGLKIEGKSHPKKRQSLMTEGVGTQLLSPKKEKKIKKESIG